MKNDNKAVYVECPSCGDKLKVRDDDIYTCYNCEYEFYVRRGKRPGAIDDDDDEDSDDD